MIVIGVLKDNSKLRVLVHNTLELDGDLEVVLQDQWRLQDRILKVWTIVNLSLRWRHLFSSGALYLVRLVNYVI